MEFDELPEFQKDLRRLLKKYRSLREDLEVLKKVLGAEGSQHPQPPMSFRIPNLGFESPAIIKVKKFASKSIKPTFRTPQAPFFEGGGSAKGGLVDSEESGSENAWATFCCEESSS